MSITAAQVKELRERTGLGMMECKSALVECDGDMERAVELLRKRAGAKVQKKAGRTAADGRIAIHTSADRRTMAMVEVNCETDFVAKEGSFSDFVDAIAACVGTGAPRDVAALLALPLREGKADTVGETCEHLVARLGEKISIRRFVRYATTDGLLDAYVHTGARIGVLVELVGGQETLAHDIAMHVAAMRPEYLSVQDIPAGVVSKEKEILVAQEAVSGKPAEIVEKMVAGRLAKHLGEITLLAQPFVKDPDTSVDKLLKGARARVVRFCRYEVGEGIEKGASDFAAEVMAQVKGG